MPSSGFAIACGAGGFKGVFLTGVLSAFSAAGLPVQAYGASSSSVLPAGFAALGELELLTPDYWLDGLQRLQEPEAGMSEVILAGIERYGSGLSRRLLAPGRGDFFIAASAVITPEAAAITQGPGARRLGRQLLLEAARKDRRWVDQNLDLHLYGTRSVPIPSILPLTAGNFEAVAYASSRMLHAWDVPAWVDGQAYIDAAYTCVCPAVELAELGYERVIALVNEPTGTYRDLFGIDPIPARYQATQIDLVAPDVDPVEVGVDYTRASRTGIEAVFSHGVQKARDYLKGLSDGGGSAVRSQGTSSPEKPSLV